MEMARLLTQLLRRPAPANNRGASIPFEVASAKPTERSFTRELKQLRSSARDTAPAKRPEPVKRPEDTNSSHSDKAEAPRDETAPAESTHVEARQDAEAQSAGTIQVAVALAEPVADDAELTSAAPVGEEATGAETGPTTEAQARGAASPWKASLADESKILQATVAGGLPDGPQPELKPLGHAIPIEKLATDKPDLELAEKQKLAASQETGRAGWAGRRFVADTSARHQPQIKSQNPGVPSSSTATDGGQTPGTLSATPGRAEDVIKAIGAVQTSASDSSDGVDTASGLASAREAAEGGAVAQRQAAAKSKSSGETRVDRSGKSPANGASTQGPVNVAGNAAPPSSNSAGVGVAALSREAIDRVSVSRIEGDSAAATLAKTLLTSHNGDASGNSAVGHTASLGENVASSAGNVTSSGERAIATPARSFSAVVSQQSPAAARVAELLLAQQPAAGGLDAAVRLLGGASGSGKQEVTLQLDPPELGRMRLEVRMEEQTMSLRVDVQSRAVAKLVETRLPELRDALSAHGISIDKSQVIIRTADTHGGSLGRESDSNANQQPGGHHGGSDGFFSEGQAGRDGGAGQTWRDGWTPAGSADDAWSAAREVAAGEEVGGFDFASPASIRVGAMNLVA